MKKPYKKYFVQFTVPLELAAVVKARSEKEAKEYFALKDDEITTFLIERLKQDGSDCYEYIKVTDCMENEFDSDVDFDLER